MTPVPDPSLQGQALTAKVSTHPGWALWTDWCATQGMPPLPATTDVLLEFLTACPAAPATLTKRVRLIDRAHETLGYPAPGSTPQARDVLRGRPACPPRQTFSTEQIDAALRVLPVHGWTQGWFGRRDRALLVLAFQVGLSYRQIGRLTAGDVSIAGDGTATIHTTQGPVQLRPRDEATLCGPCALALWLQALDAAVRFQPIDKLLKTPADASAGPAHACRAAAAPTAAAPRVALLPPTDQWGAIPLDPPPLSPGSLSLLAREHGAGRHPPHRDRQQPAETTRPLLPERDTTPTTVGPLYTAEHWRAGVQRRHDDKARLTDIDTVLDDIDRRATELERRTRGLLDAQRTFRFGSSDHVGWDPPRMVRDGGTRGAGDPG